MRCLHDRVREGVHHSIGLWQWTGAVGEEDPAHPDDTLGRVLK